MLLSVLYGGPGTCLEVAQKGRYVRQLKINGYAFKIAWYSGYTG
jgi:hypothetical protein